MKAAVNGGDTVESFAGRYNLTPGRLRVLNDGLPDEDDAVLQGVAELEVGGDIVKIPDTLVVDDDLLALHQITLDRLAALNDAIEGELRRKHAAARKLQKRINGISYLIIDPVVAVVDDHAPPPVDDNPDFHWLIYETRVNAEDFQKQATPVAYGLYAVPLDHRVEVVASRVLPDALVAAFFPGMSKDDVIALTEQSCRWRGARAERTGHGPNSGAAQSVARSEAVIHVPRMMVMPYNYCANDQGSHAIGTTLAEEIVPGPAFRLKKFWPLWETASRSSVSVLSPTSEADLAPDARLDAQWTYRSRVPPDGAPMPQEFADQPFVLGAHANCYSVKTGVRWLGKVAQGSEDAGGGKDVLESNALLASMRSDWVEHVEATIGAGGNLVVLRELLTVTVPNRFRKTRDGYQIRDLSPLDDSKIYFPPLSIPFGGRQLVAAYNAKHQDAQLTFTEYWQNAYADAVGRAKAELLIRYGLQLTTPNPQNFLLELERDTLEPTGRVVIRDIGDAKIHSEVIGAIRGDHPAIAYELEADDRPGYLPAQTNNENRRDDHYTHARFDQYPLDTRTHWHQYSTFKDKYGGAYLPEQMMTTVVWGRAHYRGYVDHLATTLGLPALRVPIFGRAAYERVLAAAEEPEPNKSKGEYAKRTLPRALARAGDDHEAITPDVYRTMLQAAQCSMTDVIYSEWALELHTDELLHELLARPATLDKIKEPWNA